MVEWLKTAESESREEEFDGAQAGTVTAEDVNKPAQINGTGTVFFRTFTKSYI